MEKEYIVYKHTNKINGKVYIGQTCQDPEKRWRLNGVGYKDSPKFWNAIQKYGWDNFEHEIIEEKLNSKQADEREVYWIAYYDTYNNDEKGYNMTPGGSNYMRKLWQNEEYRNRMKKSFSIARKKSWSNKEFAENALSILLDGLHRAWNDPDWREKRIQNLLNEKNPNSKAVINLETGLKFSTIKEASKWAGLSSVSGIGQCCKGTRKSAGKHPITKEPLHWKSIDDLTSNEIIFKKAQHINKKEVICLNNNKIFESMSAAARWCGLKDNGKSIKACCIGAQKTAGSNPETGERLKWSFVEGGEE